MKFLPYSLFILLLPVFFAACRNDDFGDQPDGFFVTGVVRSDDGTLLEGVLINSVVDTVVSDSAGQYTVLAYPLGPIQYTKPGFNKWIESVRSREAIDVTLIKIPSDSSTVFNIKLVDQQCDNGATIPVTIVEVKDFGKGTGNITWSRDKVWVLKNKVFVNEGQTLTIEPGTIVKGGSGQAESACALVVARGGTLIANGKPNLPVIFTAESDAIVRDIDGSLCTGTNLSKSDKGLWGGVVICGKAVLNSDPAQSQAEGIPSEESRALYGGNNDDDNSGIIRYVSIRHAGTELSVGNEINGLTLAGVGSGTTIEHVETFACDDDGFEFFGGRVNTKYLVSAYNGDDAFDYDEGWRGLNQYWFAVQENDADRGGEHDGGFRPETGIPYATPVIWNAFYKGPGTGTGKRALSFRANAGGEYHNSIFMSYAFGADLQYLGPNEQDCYKMFQVQKLVFKNNILFDILNTPVFSIDNKSPLPNNDAAVQFVVQTLNTYFQDTGNGNMLTDPGLDVKFVPQPGGAATQSGSTNSNLFFDAVDYRGCFAPGQVRWIDGWARAAKEL